MSADPETEPEEKQEENAEDSRDEENWENEGGAAKEDPDSGED